VLSEKGGAQAVLNVVDRSHKVENKNFQGDLVISHTGLDVALSDSRTMPTRPAVECLKFVPSGGLIRERREICNGFDGTVFESKLPTKDGSSILQFCYC